MSIVMTIIWSLVTACQLTGLGLFYLFVTYVFIEKIKQLLTVLNDNNALVHNALVYFAVSCTSRETKKHDRPVIHSYLCNIGLLWPVHLPKSRTSVFEDAFCAFYVFEFYLIFPCIYVCRINKDYLLVYLLT